MSEITFVAALRLSDELAILSADLKASSTLSNELPTPLPTSELSSAAFSISLPDFFTRPPITPSSGSRAVFSAVVGFDITIFRILLLICPAKNAFLAVLAATLSNNPTATSPRSPVRREKR